MRRWKRRAFPGDKWRSTPQDAKKRPNWDAERNSGKEIAKSQMRIINFLEPEMKHNSLVSALMGVETKPNLSFPVWRLEISRLRYFNNFLVPLVPSVFVCVYWTRRSAPRDVCTRGLPQFQGTEKLKPETILQTKEKRESGKSFPCVWASVWLV